MGGRTLVTNAVSAFIRGTVSTPTPIVLALCMGLAESLCASGGQRRPSLDEEKLSDGIIISNEKLPAPVFVFANRVRCTPGVDDDGGAVGCGSIKPVYW
jgi:hypothetical protein